MFDLNMENYHSPLAQLLQSSIGDNFDTPTSLFDLINAHKSSKEEPANEDVQSLADYTSKHLNLKDDTDNAHNDKASQSKILTRITSNDKVENCDGNSGNFKTLEEYTQSFMSANSRAAFLDQKPLPLDVRKVSPESVQVNTNVLNEKLSNIKISDACPHEIRKIDLTAALSNSTQTASVPSNLRFDTRSNESVFYPVEDCIIDLSALADADILYCNNELSQFGYVISRTWNHQPLPKKYRKIGRAKPYNIKSSFKFDTPSPDDVALKARNRTFSSSKD